MTKKERAQIRFLLDVVKTYYWRKISYVCEIYYDDVFQLDNGLHIIMDTIEQGKFDEAIKMIYNKNMEDGFEQLLNPDYKDWYQRKEIEKKNGFTNQQRLFRGSRNLSSLIPIGKEGCRLIKFPGTRGASGG